MPSSPSVPATPVATPAEPGALTPLTRYELAAKVWDGPITVAQYLMGRDKNPAYARDVTPALLANAERTTQCLNAVMDAMRADGLAIEWNPAAVGRTPLNSGWRPFSVNLGVPGASMRSKHITAEAGDLHDPDGALDDWCMANFPTLMRIGLWLEHPSSTKGWCHLQTVAPRSGNRVFFP